MKVSVVVNPSSGTLRNVNMELLQMTLRKALTDSGLQMVSWHAETGSVIDALQSAVKRNPDCLMIGGGDGSVSAAARVARANGLVLAILPGGTMNLYSRTLGLPLDIIECAREYARSRVIEVDVATVGDRVFLHQFTVGLHAQAIRLRNTMAYGSRMSKILASIKAFARVVFRPPRLKVDLTVDGRPVGLRTVSALSITNNVFGEGHIPYADVPDGGVLGIYYSEPIRFAAALRLVVDSMRGTTQENPHLHEAAGTEVSLRFLRKRNKGMLDGEIVRLEKMMHVTIHPRSLKVLLPEVARGKT